MTRDEQERVKTLHDALTDALMYLESGRTSEGLDWVRIAKRLSGTLVSGKRREKVK
ncbi:TPA: hypothetical protein ACIBS5_002863 [Salmonella enterica subsp. diarizonae serovar 60-67:z35:-]